MLAGLVGTAGMSLSMGFIHAKGWANADMIRALGSLVTRSYERSFGPGLGIHLVGGQLFAVPYAVILGAFGETSFLTRLVLGAVLGLVHGLVMSLLLLVAVSERHPVEEFQEAGLEVAGAHVVGHVAYGIGVAVVVAALGIDWGIRL